MKEGDALPQGDAMPKIRDCNTRRGVTIPGEDMLTQGDAISGGGTQYSKEGCDSGGRHITLRGGWSQEDAVRRVGSGTRAMQ